MSGITVKGAPASKQQVEMMRRALRYADKVGAPYRAKVALLEALTQESEFKNLSTPSADGYGSYGVLQGLERYHGRKNLMNPEYQFGIFLGRNKKYPKGFTGKGNAVDLARRGMKSGDIAQAVEGSAYPDRYQTSQKEVMRNIRLLRAADGQPMQRDVSAVGKQPAGASAPQQGFDAEGYDAARRKAIGMQLLAQRNPNSILVKTGVLDPTPPNPADFQIAQKQATTKSRAATHGTAPAAGSSGGGGLNRTDPTNLKGTAVFEGVRVAAWIKPALEYGRRHGWKGKVNSGFRSFADQTRIYNSGVRPAARPGTSNHEGADFPRGAVDVSDAATLSRILARSPYARALKYAGAKDPVHFSHPHNGSY